MHKKLKLVTFFLVICLTVVVAAVVSVSLPHSHYIRYQSFHGTIFSRLSWVYDRLVHDETPIDVLLIGSSRTARGIDAAGLQSALDDRGFNVNVANLSLPASGFDQRMTVIRDATKHHDVKLVVWGITEVFPRDGHQIFADFGSVEEILSSPWLINRNLPVSLARLPYRQIKNALANVVPEAFGYRSTFDPNNYLGLHPDLRLFNDPSWNREKELGRIVTEAHKQSLAKESKLRKRNIRPPILPDALRWAEFGVSRNYVRELVELAEVKGFSLAFVHLPFYKGHPVPLEDAWLAQFGPVWKAQFLMDDPINYIDAGHPSEHARPMIVSWMADNITEILE